MVEFTVGATTVETEMFSLRLNAKAYPLCLKLGSANLVARWVAGKGVIDATEEEMGDLITLAYLSAKASDPSLTQEVFEDRHMSPGQLMDAFILARYQTGMWKPILPGEEAPPEDQGEATPPTSTSEISSQG